MKIRHKLTLSFSVTVALILVIFGIAIYYFSSQYRKSEFNNRLVERVEITEKIFLEKDNLPKETYELIREQFLNKLPGETEQVMALKDKQGLQTTRYPHTFIDKLLEKEEASFESGSLQGVGKIFHLGEGDYAVILTATDEAGNRMLRHLRIILVLALATCIIVVALVGYYISGKELNPLTQKIKKANAISVKNLHERLTIHNPKDEIGELTIAFNNLLDRVTAAFEAQRSFIDSASHEMRNPLTAIIGEADVTLEKERSKTEYVDSIRLIATEAERLNALVNNLLQLATISYREPEFKTETVNIQELLVEARKKYDFSCPENDVALHLDTQAPAAAWLVQGNSHLLQTAIINILDNASKFSFYKKVDVYLTANGNGTISLSVHDKGVGIPAEDIPKVRQPFHRAFNVRKIQGTGIGIPLALKIVELHKGTLDIRSEIDKGTVVTISLPNINEKSSF